MRILLAIGMALALAPPALADQCMDEMRAVRYALGHAIIKSTVRSNVSKLMDKAQVYQTKGDRKSCAITLAEARKLLEGKG